MLTSANLPDKLIGDNLPANDPDSGGTSMSEPTIASPPARSSRDGIVVESRPNELAALANHPEDYQRLGLSSTTIEPWEDGARTDDSAGTYEWWYFDAHLADGAKLVVAFMNKDIAEPHKPLSPLLRLQLDPPYRRPLWKLNPFSAQGGVG